MSRQEWRRPKGFKPTYTKADTKRYVSKRARLVRGLSISPDGRERSGNGWIFWFLSSRGPVKYGGRHRVDAVRVNEEGGGELEGDGPFFFEPPDPSRWFYATALLSARKTGRYQYPSVPIGLTFTSSNFESGFDNPFLYVRGEPLYIEYELSPGQSVYRSQIQNPYPFFDYTLTSERYPSTISIPPGRRAGLTFTGTGIYRTFELGVYDGAIRESFVFVNANSIGGGDLTHFRWLPGTPTFEIGLSTLSFYEAGFFDPNPTTPPLPGTGGGIPEGYLAPGPWAYRCSCPDFNHSEDPLQFARWPSQKLTRSWEQIRPSSPCKHMVSAAVGLGDSKAIGDWSREAGADLFPDDPLTLADLKRMDEILNGPQQRTPSRRPPTKPPALPRPTRWQVIQDVKAYNERIQREAYAYADSVRSQDSQYQRDITKYMGLVDSYLSGKRRYDTNASKDLQRFYEDHRQNYQPVTGPIDFRTPIK